MRTEEKLRLVSESPLNAETPPSAWLEEVTPNAQFYVRNHFDIPKIKADEWRLKVSGNVEQALNFTMQDIQAMPKLTQRVLLECAGNGRSTLVPPIKGTTWGFGAVAQAEFTGTPLKNLLDKVVPGRESVEALFIGADFGKVRTGEEVPYARSMPIDATRDQDVILCWEMNGEPLPKEHGFPLRLLVPGRYGMSSVKWLSEIQLQNEVFQGFFQVDDYVYVQAEGEKDGTPVGPMRVRSLFASHEDSQEIPIGKHRLEGIAWSGEGGVREVLLSTDGGENWKPTALTMDPNFYAWIRWSIDCEFAEPGNYKILCRAKDSAGNQQPLEQYWNKGGYGNNIVQSISLKVGA